jgi:5-methyltetrahydropteroyltriglutamate--homocysteine methyltransferase
MKRSTDHILTTHTGSLPRPARLLETLRALGDDTRPDPDPDAFAAHVRDAVGEIVARQVEAGVDVVSDGEMSKASYTTYVTERLSGFGGKGQLSGLQDMVDYPEWAASAGWDRTDQVVVTPACIGDVAYVDREPLEADLDNLRTAADAASAHDVFVTATSPGIVTHFLENQHYPSHEAYLEALGAALKTEYDAIHAAGFTLQLDCPDLAAGRSNVRFANVSLEDWRRRMAQHIDVLNEATRDIPPEDMRLHLCWGNYEGPHDHDVALGDILDIVLRARPAAIAFEGANPRHAHEWRVFEDVDLPDDKILIPGVIDSTTNYIEHPELIAERILHYANAVGRERVIAGTDCGFATFAGMAPVDPKVVFAKLAALAEGAALASGELWSGQPAHRKVALATS